MTKTDNTRNRKIFESWSGMIKKQTGVTSNEKLGWMSQMAHNYKLNEAAMPNQGFDSSGMPYNQLFNTVGIGDPRFPQRAETAGNFNDPSARGTGDTWNQTLDIALQVAARTIGTELVNVKPINTPTGALSFFDYVYSGGKNPYGPYGNNVTSNPEYFGKLDNDKDKFKPTNTYEHGGGGKNLYSEFGNPALIKVTPTFAKAEDKVKFYTELRKVTKDSTKMVELRKPVDCNGLKLVFVAVSRLSGDIIFRVMPQSTASVGAAFGGDGTKPAEAVAIPLEGIKNAPKGYANPRLVSAVEDHIQGYTGSGTDDADPWSGTYVDGTTLYEPMSRGVGELTYPRQLSATIFTRRFEVGTYAVSIAVTDEMMTDYQKTWNIDIFKMIKEQAANEISQSINKHILSRLFGLGWKNAVDTFTSTGITFNINLSDKETLTPAYAYPVNSADSAGPKGYVNQALPYSVGLAVNKDGASFQNAQIMENNDSGLKRIMNQILAASAWVAQRGRRGPATDIVMSTHLAAALQVTAQYSLAPIANTINQAAGALYPAGKFAGMNVYVDPMMDISDSRILLLRKGNMDEPGVVFCPYQLAHSIEFISEGIGSHKAIVKSRYALVNAGFYPELQYFTFDVKLGFGTVLAEAAKEEKPAGTSSAASPFAETIETKVEPAKPASKK